MLGRDADAFQIPLAAALQRLPEILSRAEIATVLACVPHLKARTLLSCGYALGLRVSELCALRPDHIDSAADRMCVRVVQGKGARDRYVPLSEELFELLRLYWRAALSPASRPVAKSSASPPSSAYRRPSRTEPAVSAHFLQLVQPAGFKRIRHYGLLAPKAKPSGWRSRAGRWRCLWRTRRTLEDAQAFMRRVAAIEIDCCPHCRIGRWVTIEAVAAPRPLATARNLLCRVGRRREPSRRNRLPASAEGPPMSAQWRPHAGALRAHTPRHCGTSRDGR